MTKNVWIEKIRGLCKYKKIAVTDELEVFFSKYGEFDGPASCGHHLNKVWGFWEHTYNVAITSIELNEKYEMGYDNYYVLLPALGHDLDKVDMGYQVSLNKPKKDQVVGDISKVRTISYKKEKAEIGHGENSMLIANRVFTLDSIQNQAIRWHMGMFTYDADFKIVSDKMMRLQTIIMLADYMSTRFMEVTYPFESDEFQALCVLLRGRGDIRE